MKAVLALEDGTMFTGEAFGAAGTTIGEVVFHTGMTGYQEVLTDASCAGQIVVLTYPLIGNYGINDEDIESSKPHAKGLVVRELCHESGNWRATGSLEDYLAKNNIVGIQGIDTRALTRILRDKGTMNGAISTDQSFSTEDLAGEICRLTAAQAVSEVSTRELIHLEGAGHRVALLDYGVKKSIIQSLKKLGCDIYVFPAESGSDEILAVNPGGIMLSNGPGNPKECKFQIKVIRELLGKRPVFGIGLGHQLAALAGGGEIERLKYGHRGENHPVKDLSRDITYITSQNHGYTVSADSLDKKAVISHISMNDGTVEGIRYSDTPTLTVQFHPEVCSGLMGTSYLFYEFKAMMDKYSMLGGSK